MQKIDKAQTTVLNLIFNSLHFDEWYMQGRFIGQGLFMKGVASGGN
jgi:hypothetical protein